MGHGIEMEVCQGTGSGVGVRKTQEKMARKVHRGVWKGVQVGVEPGWGPGWPEWVCMYAQKLENEEWVWWAHRKYPTHRKSGATRAGL